MDLFRDKLRCKKLYPYLNRNISMSGEIPNIFSFSNLKITAKINRKASALAILMDDFQFRQCQNAKECDKKDPKRKYYLNLRDIIYGRLFVLETTLIVMEHNPKKLEKYLEKNLEAIHKAFEYEDSIEQMSKILDSQKIKTEIKPDRSLEY